MQQYTMQQYTMQQYTMQQYTMQLRHGIVASRTGAVMMACSLCACKQKGQGTFNVLPVHVQDINERPHDKGLKSVYSNAVSAEQVAALKEHAVSILRFQKIETKGTVSVHVGNKDYNTTTVLSFKQTDSG